MNDEHADQICNHDCHVKLADDGFQDDQHLRNGAYRQGVAEPDRGDRDKAEIDETKTKGARRIRKLKRSGRRLFEQQINVRPNVSQNQVQIECPYDLIEKDSFRSGERTQYYHGTVDKEDEYCSSDREPEGLAEKGAELFVCQEIKQQDAKSPET
jgi:hypothetical protein